MPPPVNLTRDEQRRLIHAVQTDPQWSHMTPDDILGTAQTVFVKLARHLTSRGYETTPAQARELMHKHRYDISPELVLTDALAFFDFEPGSDEAEYMRGQFELLGKDGFLEWLRKLVHEPDEDDDDDGDGDDTDDFCPRDTGGGGVATWPRSR